MNHEELKESVFALHDGELADAEHRETESHLEGCAECRLTLENWKKISVALFHEEAPVSEAFVQRVMEAIPPSAVGRRPSAISLRWLAPAFGMAILALILIFAKPAAEPVSAEALLLADGREGAVTELAFLPESPGKDEILGYVLEESWGK